MNVNYVDINRGLSDEYDGNVGGNVVGGAGGVGTLGIGAVGAISTGVGGVVDIAGVPVSSSLITGASPIHQHGVGLHGHSAQPGHSSQPGQSGLIPVPSAQPQLPQSSQHSSAPQYAPSYSTRPGFKEYNDPHYTQPPALSAYPDFTTYLNNNPSQPAPTVDAVFIDQITCPICGRNNFKSLKRHIKIHQSTPRFRCRFPRSICSFKINSYNRAFDFKRHLTNKHFKFDNPEAKRRPGLTTKLDCVGTCACGRRSTARDWLDRHLLTDDDNERCQFFRN